MHLELDPCVNNWEMKYSDTLLKSNTALLKSSIEHPFIAGLCEGTIPKEAFRQYVIQDFMICQAARRLLSIVVAKLPSTVYDQKHKWVDEVIPALGKQITPGPETKALQLFLKQLGVSQTELTQANLVTRAFSDFIVSTGFTGGYKESLIVLLAMNFVYESWAERFESAQPGDPLVKEWIQVHRDKVMGPRVEVLKRALDESRPHFTKISRKHAEALKYTLLWTTSFWESLSNTSKLQWAV